MRRPSISIGRASSSARMDCCEARTSSGVLPKLPWLRNVYERSSGNRAEWSRPLKAGGGERAFRASDMGGTLAAENNEPDGRRRTSECRPKPLLRRCFRLESVRTLR